MQLFNQIHIKIILQCHMRLFCQWVTSTIFPSLLIELSYINETIKAHNKQKQ